MSSVSSPVRLHLPALAVGFVALLGAACSGSPAGPTSPSPVSATSTSLGAGGGGASSAGKVDVCHRSGGGFHLINVSGNALQSHLAHGDGQPLGSVPGAAGQVFGAACQIQMLRQHTITLVSGTGGGVGSLDPAISYAKASGGTGTAVILRQHGAYASLPGANWVNWSIITTAFDNGFGTPHLGDDVTYSIGFTLPAGATNASLTGTFYADNRGDGFLNGASIGGHPASPFGGGFSTAAAVNATSGFVAGANTLSFTVRDDGGVAGLAFSVTITYFAP